MIDAAGADAGGGFRTVDDPVWMILEDGLVLHGLVVETRNVHLLRKFVANGVLPLIERRCGRTRRILLVKKVGQAPGLLPTVGIPLLGDLVADAPQDDAGMIPIPSHHIAQVPLGPLIEVL